MVYIGRQGTSYTTIRSITITTPAPVYLKPHADWLAKESGVNPRFAVYYFKSAAPTDYGWVSMTQDSGCDEDYFRANIPSGYDKCIFCRMKGNETTNKWENKINQTGDLTVPTGKAIFYTVPSGGDAGTDADWSANPFKACVTGTWLYFKGETITLNVRASGQAITNGIKVPILSPAPHHQLSQKPIVRKMMPGTIIARLGWMMK